MKLSDAMVLGICRYKLDPSEWICEDGGCLLGVAALANGFSGNLLIDVNDDADNAIVTLWPWLDSEVEIPQFVKDLPSLPRHYLGDIRTYYFPHIKSSSKESAINIISCLAFYVKRDIVSVEKVIEWIRSVEPQEQVSIEHVKEISAETVSV